MILKKCKSTNTGFTLIELLVSIGVFSLIAGIGISVFIALNATYDKASVISSVNHEGSRVMESIIRTIRSGTDVESVSSNRIKITIPREVDNLEYSSNGNCTEVEIYYDSASKTIRKSSPSGTGICDATALCPNSDPCILTSNEVDILNLTFTLTQTTGAPTKVDIVFNMQQDASLSDPEQQSSQRFQRVVLTRGY